MWDRRCQITRVKDGDTVVVYVDDGKREFAEEDIRLFGTWAPEEGQEGYVETTQFAQEWIDRRKAGPWPFTVIKMRNKKDTLEQMTFGRYVGMIFDNVNHEYLNTAVAAFVADHNYPRGTGG